MFGLVPYLLSVGIYLGEDMSCRLTQATSWHWHYEHRNIFANSFKAGRHQMLCNLWRKADDTVAYVTLMSIENNFTTNI